MLTLDEFEEASEKVKEVTLENGSFSFPDSFAEIRNGEVFLRNFHINEYSYSSIFNHNPDRLNKLLAAIAQNRKALLIQCRWQIAQASKIKIIYLLVIIVICFCF